MDLTKKIFHLIPILLCIAVILLIFVALVFIFRVLFFTRSSAQNSVKTTYVFSDDVETENFYQHSDNLVSGPIPRSSLTYKGLLPSSDGKILFNFLNYF